MTPDELRQHAAECDERAEVTRDPEVKWQLRDLARQWRDIADQLDELDKLNTRMRA